MKTDRLDALALLNALVTIDRGERHVCSVVRVLSVEEEDARRSHRERDRLIHERTAHINRIKGLLFAQGIRDIEPRMRRTRIDFGAMRTAEGHPLPTRLRSELEREYARLDMARRILIEISWLWLRYQPQTALAQWYNQRTRGQGLRIRRVMLVALARKLAIVL